MALVVTLTALSVGGCGSSSPSDVLTIAVNGSGTTDPAVGVHSYDSETSVTLSAQADNGYTFAGWSGDLSDMTNPVTTTMDSDKSVTAIFEALYYA